MLQFNHLAYKGTCIYNSVLRRGGGMEEAIKGILYTDKGIEWTMKIWGEFKKGRK